MKCRLKSEYTILRIVHVGMIICKKKKYDNMKKIRHIVLINIVNLIILI